MNRVKNAFMDPIPIYFQTADYSMAVDMLQMAHQKGWLLISAITTRQPVMTMLCSLLISGMQMLYSLLSNEV